MPPASRRSTAKGPGHRAAGGLLQHRQPAPRARSRPHPPRHPGRPGPRGRVRRQARRGGAAPRDKTPCWPSPRPAPTACGASTRRPPAPARLAQIFRESEKEYLHQSTREPVITYPRYLAEHAARERNQHYIDAAYWLAERFGVARGDAQAWHVFCESVINSALLVLFTEKKPGGFFSVDRSVKLAEAARKKRGSDSAPSKPGWATPRRRCAGSSSGNARVLRRRSAAHPARGSGHRDLPQPGPLLGPVFFDNHWSARSPTTTRPAPKEWRRMHRHPRASTWMCSAGVLLMVACGLEPARACARRTRWSRSGTPSARGLRRGRRGPLHRRGGALQYQADVRRMDDDLGPEARVDLDSDGRYWVLGLPAGKPARRAGEARLRRRPPPRTGDTPMSTEMQTVQTDHINFKDIDKGYEPFAEALALARVRLADRARGRTQGLLPRLTAATPLLFFQLPAVGQGQQGQKPTERAGDLQPVVGHQRKPGGDPARTAPAS